MPYIVKAIGIFLIVVGVMNFLIPQNVRKFIEFAKVGKRVYIGGAVRIAVGALLLISIPSVTFPWLPGLVGLVALAGGVLLIVMGPEKDHAFMDKIAALPDSKLSKIPLLAGVVGVLLVYSV
jgi:uncharacterized protein YjeT (DUF2065 family)